MDREEYIMANLSKLRLYCPRAVWYDEGSKRLYVVAGWSDDDNDFFHQRALWAVWIHQYDWEIPRYEASPGFLVAKLPGNPRNGYEIVAKRVGNLKKIRRRIEDRLRKDEAFLLRVCQSFVDWAGSLDI